ncbi:MAG TPA: hypothetical protein VEI81_03640 [Methanoregula sp.]|nr:hypothetical protein [Methanoregula sp.]
MSRDCSLIIRYLMVTGAVLLLPLVSLPVSAITLSPGSGTASTATISNGDSVFINGIATGHPQLGLQVWVIGPNYLKVSSVSVNQDNTYSFELRPADTLNLAPGQYFVVVQHPMMNGRFDITYDPGTGEITNQQLGNGGTVIFQISGGGSLQSPDAAYALVRAISTQNVDDTFAPASFTIRVPGATIDPIADHVVGDKFTISGDTNLVSGDALSVTVTSSSFAPTSKSQSGEFSGASGVVKVAPGTNGLNRWSFDVDTSAWKPDEYIVTVTGVTIDVTGSAHFSLLASRPPATAGTTETTAIVPVTSATAEPPATLPSAVSPAQPAPTRSPVSPVTPLAALGLLFIAARAGKRK